MTRRKFVSRSANFAGLMLGAGELCATDMGRTEGQTVRLKIDIEKPLGMIPANFIGLGYEISSIARPGLLSAKNRTYVQLARTLGVQGVIRVGGNTSDYSSFAPDRQAVSAPKETVVNEANLQELGAFLDATGWKLIWGLNLGGGTEQEAINEAQAVATIARDNLLAFEIGNEPDLFGHRQAHRPAAYRYQYYLNEYRRYKAAIRAKLPNAPFAGPDAASATDWVTRFGLDEGNDLRLLTHHYYRECASPASTLDKLLQPDPKLAPDTGKTQSGIRGVACALSDLRSKFLLWRRKTRRERHVWRSALGTRFYVHVSVRWLCRREHGDRCQSAWIYQFIFSDRRRRTRNLLGEA